MPGTLIRSPRKLFLAGAGHGLQTRCAALVSRVGSTPTSFRRLFSIIYRSFETHVPTMYHPGMSERNELSLSRRHTMACHTAGKTPEPRKKRRKNGHVRVSYRCGRISCTGAETSSTSFPWYVRLVAGHHYQRRAAGSSPCENFKRRFDAGTGYRSGCSRQISGVSGAIIDGSLKEPTLRKYVVLLKTRLLPFCDVHEIARIADFDDYGTMESFVHSRANLNPHRNRKVAPVSVSVPVPLGAKPNGWNWSDYGPSWPIANFKNGTRRIRQNASDQYSVSIKHNLKDLFPVMVRHGG
jgi:hypothetical protein